MGRREQEQEKLAPIIEVIDVDEEGEVGQGTQHEGGDEAGGDVVVGLADEVDHQLEQGSVRGSSATFLVSLFPPASTMV